MTPSLRPSTPASMMIRESLADRVASLQWAIVIALTLLSVWLILVWLCLEGAPLPRPSVEISPAEFDGGGTAQPEQYSVQIPFDQEASDVPPLQIDGIAAVILSSADVELPASGDDLVGEPGDGTGEGPLSGPGSDEPGRVRHWMFVVPQVGTRERYLSMLEQLQFQTAAVFPDGRVVLLVQDGSDRSQVIQTTVEQEQRMHLRWDAGRLEEIDRADFAAARVDVASATVVQLMSADTRLLLDRLEFEYANRMPGQIRRTAFRIVIRGNEAVFEVESQKAK